MRTNYYTESSNKYRVHYGNRLAKFYFDYLILYGEDCDESTFLLNEKVCLDAFMHYLSNIKEVYAKSKVITEYKYFSLIQNEEKYYEESTRQEDLNTLKEITAEKLEYVYFKLSNIFEEQENIINAEGYSIEGLKSKIAVKAENARVFRYQAYKMHFPDFDEFIETQCSWDDFMKLSSEERLGRLYIFMKRTKQEVEGPILDLMSIDLSDKIETFLKPYKDKLTNNSGQTIIRPLAEALATYEKSGVLPAEEPDNKDCIKHKMSLPDFQGFLQALKNYNNLGASTIEKVLPFFISSNRHKPISKETIHSYLYRKPSEGE